MQITLRVTQVTGKILQVSRYNLPFQHCCPAQTAPGPEKKVCVPAGRTYPQERGKREMVKQVQWYH